MTRAEVTVKRGQPVAMHSRAGPSSALPAYAGVPPAGTGTFRGHWAWEPRLSGDREPVGPS